jgi:hypothetical protein
MLRFQGFDSVVSKYVAGKMFALSESRHKKMAMRESKFHPSKSVLETSSSPIVEP